MLDASSSVPISLAELLLLRRQSNSNLDVGGEAKLVFLVGYVVNYFVAISHFPD